MHKRLLQQHLLHPASVQDDPLSWKHREHDRGIAFDCHCLCLIPNRGGSGMCVDVVDASLDILHGALHGKHCTKTIRSGCRDVMRICGSTESCQSTIIFARNGVKPFQHKNCCPFTKNKSCACLVEWTGCLCRILIAPRIQCLGLTKPSNGQCTNGRILWHPQSQHPPSPNSAIALHLQESEVPLHMLSTRNCWVP